LVGYALPGPVDEFVVYLITGDVATVSTLGSPARRRPRFAELERADD
jgi:hypothetical protein